MMEAVHAVPVFLFFACVAGLAVALFAIAALLNPRQYVGPVQKMPYESGMDPIHDTRRRFDVRFYLIAIAFLVFDVEVLFLYPWAVAAKRQPGSITVGQTPSSGGQPVFANSPKAAQRAPSATGPLPRRETGTSAPIGDISMAVKAGLVSSRDIVFAATMVFIALVGLGFLYDWRKGVFQWR